MMDIKLIKIWNHPLTLETIRRVTLEDNNEISEKIRGMALLKRNRLSVQPLLPSEWDGIITLKELNQTKNPK